MPDILDRKVGIVACSCEELAEGTVARLAALKVLHELRPRDTVTICLPLFLAGGAADRAFAGLHPTIAVDGCELCCAARATEKYSNHPVASVVVNDLVSESGLERPEGRRRLNAAGQQVVAITAARLASLVDQILDKEADTFRASGVGALEAQGKPREATCSCGSGVAVTKLIIHGQTVELIALPQIFRHFWQARAAAGPAADLDEATAREVFEAVKIYNSVPEEAEQSFREAVLREYVAFCQKEKP